MDANERYEKIKELITKRESLVTAIDEELSSLFRNGSGLPTNATTNSTRVCGTCGVAGHNSRSCPTKEKGTTLSADPIV